MMINQQIRFPLSVLLLAALVVNAQAAVTTLSVHFESRSSHEIPPDAANVAGAVPVSFWNNSGSDGLSSATLNDGSSFDIGVSMNADQSHLQIADPDDNDQRLMGDSFDLHGGTLTLSISNLPSEFTSQGYDVYLYLWGNDNPNQQGLYQVDFEPVQGTVPSIFFQQAIELFDKFDNGGQSDSRDSAGPANYVKIEGVGQGQSSFEIEITNIDGFTDDAWTVINGFQVVAVPEPSLASFLGCGGAGVVLRRRRTG